MTAFWLMAIGLGMAFHGSLIMWVGGLPRQLRRGLVPTAEKGSPEAFGLFWLDQYAWIGIGLMVTGLALTAWGYVS